MAEEIQRLSDWGQGLKLAADRGCHSAAALRRQLELDRIGHRRLQLVGFAIGGLFSAPRPADTVSVQATR